LNLTEMNHTNRIILCVVLFLILFVILKYIRSLPNKKIIEGHGGGGHGSSGRGGGYGRGGSGRSGYGGRAIAGLGGLGVGYGLGRYYGGNGGNGGYRDEFYYDEGGSDYYPADQQPVYVPEPVYVYEEPTIVSPDPAIDLIDSNYNSNSQIVN
jgi:hypothetical protein